MSSHRAHLVLTLKKFKEKIWSRFRGNLLFVILKNFKYCAKTLKIFKKLYMT